MSSCQWASFILPLSGHVSISKQSGFSNLERIPNKTDAVKQACAMRHLGAKACLRANSATFVLIFVAFLNGELI
jgi:hypothetical protein